MFYLDLSQQVTTENCSHCNQKTRNKATPSLSGEIEDLSEFQSLKGLNASNNQFTRLNGIFSLPNKNKVEKINFFGNQIKEVDLAKLFSEFPNLKYLNLDYNPLSAKNLENLTSEQFGKLVEGMKNKKIRLSASKGTVWTDLLEYTQKLIKKGENTEQAQQLQAIIQNSSVKKEPNKTDYAPLIIGGVLVVILALGVGYLVGKKSKNN